MKHIKLFEKFKEFDKELLDRDINGILVELKDIGYSIDVKIYENKVDITIHVNYVNTGKIKGTDIYQYILMLQDYMKYKLGKLNSTYMYWNINLQEWKCFRYSIYSNKNREYYGFKVIFTKKESN